MNKKDISDTLQLIAKLLIILEDNQFKSRAYENASRVILQLDNFDNLVESKKLNSIKGIGKSIEKEIYSLRETGESELLNNLMLNIPEGILDILSLKGLGAKKVKILYRELGISSIGELEYACNENRLMLLKGFGKKTQENIIKNILKLKERKKFFHFPEAELFVQNFLKKIKELSFIDKIAVTGDFRRKKEIINNFEFVIIPKDYLKFVKEFGEPENVEISGNNLKYIKKNFDNKLVKIYISDKENFFKHLFITTGSNDFLKNFKEISGFNKEKDFFNKNSLNYIIPECREKEILNKEPSKIIQYNSLKGVFHIHTTYSDGADNLENIVKYLISSGFSYAGISDHSKSAYYANGLKEDDIKRQFEEIDYLNEKYKPFKIFKGIESDILKDGNLDYNDKILEQFDFVIASVHSSFGLTKKAMTERIKKALLNPYTTILGHPTGRLILYRDAYEVDIDEILNTLIENNKFVEINCHPYRLDLEWENCIKASKLGIKFFINPDAHNLSGFNYLKYGINVARKAGLYENEIINTYSVNEVKELL